MNRQISLFIAGVMIAVLFLPLLTITPAKATVASTCRFGMNTSFPSGPEYTDIMWTAWWSTNAGTSFNANGYPTSGANLTLNWFSDGYVPVTPHKYDLYAEGLFTLNLPPWFPITPGTQSVLPPNYAGNDRNQSFIIPANYAGNSTNSDINEPAWTGGNQTSQAYYIPANCPANPLAVVLFIPANSPANPLSVVLTTCQITIQNPARLVGTWGGVGGQVYNLAISNINPQAIAGEDPNNFHLVDNDYGAWTPSSSFYPVTSTSYPLFTKEFLAIFAPFCEIRFMPWMNTTNNNGSSYSWASRPQMNYVGTTPNWQGLTQGTCYENIIALGNATGCDIWINIPLQRTDDWDVGMATLVANNLNPWLHCYVEYYNECWNSSFYAGWSLIDQEANADGNAGLFNPLPSWQWHSAEVAKQLMHDISIMQPIMGSKGRFVLEGQEVDPIDTIGAGLSYIQANYGPPKNYIYGAGGAAYFGTWAQEFTSPQGDPPIIAANHNITSQYGIELVAYEGGLGLQANDPGTFANYVAFDESPAATTQYINFATMWQQGGGGLCTFFIAYDPWGWPGLWGHLQQVSYINDLSDPSCTMYNAAAALNNSLGCNCGNAAPAPAPTPTPAPAPAPGATQSSKPSGGSTSASTSGSSPSAPSGVKDLGGGRFWSPIYGNYSNPSSYMTTHH